MGLLIIPPPIRPSEWNRIVKEKNKELYNLAQLQKWLDGKISYEECRKRIKL